MAETTTKNWSWTEARKPQVEEMLQKAGIDDNPIFERVVLNFFRRLFTCEYKLAHGMTMKSLQKQKPFQDADGYLKDLRQKMSKPWRAFCKANYFEAGAGLKDWF